MPSVSNILLNYLCVDLYMDHAGLLKLFGGTHALLVFASIVWSHNSGFPLWAKCLR